MNKKDDDTERTSDGLPLRFAAGFGFALLASLLLEMGLMLLLTDRFDGPPTFHRVWPLFAGIGGILLAALVVQVWLGLRGVFAGAATASLMILVFASVLLMLLQNFSSR